ncbi:MAG: hypothetical protein KAU31_11450 [Spirochaetaceae bacterium]|nr:hypothetical protein [Spirochaetaceae bacterium]
MVGAVGVIPEDVGPGAEDLSHDQRFGVQNDGDPRLQELHWRSGRDLLLVDVTSPGTDTSTLLPPRPKRVTDERLWIPVSDDDERVVGPIYRVGVRVSDPLIRVRAAEVVHFIPEMTVIVGIRRFRILGRLDGLDPSRRRQLEKMIQGSHGTALKSQALFPEPARASRSEPPSEPSSGSLPPAARTILAAIEGEALGNSHVVAFQRRGAAALLSLLEKRGLIRILPSGQIVSASRYQELCDTLGDLELEFNRRQAAKLWNASVGMAGALLDQLARDRMVDKVSSRYYKVKR